MLLCAVLIVSFFFFQQSEKNSIPKPEEKIEYTESKIIPEIKPKKITQPPAEPLEKRNTFSPTPVLQKPSEATCNDPTHYSCVRKIFNPDAKSEEYVSYECVEIPADEKHDVQKFCMNVKVFSFNTRGAYSNCNTCKPEDIEPGGRYHFEEFSCVNEGFKTEISPSNEDPFPIKNEGKNLLETFTQTYQLCHSYPEKPIGAIAQGELKGEVK